jgi:acyl carrier protein
VVISGNAGLQYILSAWRGDTISKGKNIFKKERKRETMLEKIKEIVAESLNADVDTLTEETSFKDDLGADSLDLFEMVMAFEEEFEVEIPSEDLEQINTIGDVVKYLEAHK